MKLKALLDQRMRAALTAVGAPEDTPALIQTAARPEFGDYQANGVMPAAKALRSKPRDLAQKVVDAIQLDDLADNVSIAGPGFINITFSNTWLNQQLNAAASDARLGVVPTDEPLTIVSDYSSPNLAKEMHVGHLRSTIIGDAVVRVLEFIGHRVIRQNHVGDWGTQFGMLIAYVEQLQSAGEQLSMALSDLEGFYRAAKKRFDEDEGFADTARAYVVKLQQGDEHCLKLWEQFIETSLGYCERVYERLGVTLKREHVKPESAYNDALAGIIEALRNQNLLKESDGAQCVFLDEFKGKNDDPLPLIVQKSDGGYLYATTDLAAARYRHHTLNADRVDYFVDARQSLHLKQVFAVARAAGFVDERCTLQHLAFGMMMGDNGKPFKTREGGTVRLTDLLDEAEQRALAIIKEKSAKLDETQKQAVAHAVGVGAVKYADLAKNRTGDYIFNWDTMLALEGNTAPYMLYAYARIASIFRNGEAAGISVTGEINVEHPSERNLALRLLRFEDSIDTVAQECTPHVLCAYLYDLAGAFMQFYEACPVLKAEPETQQSRLRLCQLTANTLKQGLELLGIKTVEKM